MARPILRKRAFTGDTGCNQDWQIGFEDTSCAKPCDNRSFNFLGLGSAEEKAREDVLNEQRGRYPGAKSCAEAEAVLPKIRADLAEAQRKVATGESKTVAPRYVDAFNTLLSEYTAYYNKNCLDGNAALAPTPVQPSSINDDPMVQSISPNGASTTIPGLGTQLGAPGGSNLPAGASIKTSVAGTPAGGSSSGADAPAGGVFSKVPKWAWWTGGGLLLLTTIILIAKHKKA